MVCDHSNSKKAVNVMELFSFSVSGTPLLLSVSENGLSLYPVHNERFGHPLLLCSGYKDGFSGCIYNNTLHYAYINKENALLLRRLHDPSVLFRINGTDNVSYSDPRLIVFQNLLLLFYVEKAQSSYHLKLRLPFTDDTLVLPESLQAVGSEPPFLFLHTTNRFLYLFLTVGEIHYSYRYTKSTGFQTLRSEEELLSDLRLPWETEKKQFEQGMIHALRLSEQHQTLLREKEQELHLSATRLSELSLETERANSLLSDSSAALQAAEARLAECEQSKQQTEQKLQHTSLLLDRAKAQYNELMQVAEQYRQEALKWYGKFTDRV